MSVCVCVCVHSRARAWSAATVSMQAPVCLVDNGPDGHMRVQQEALQILEQIQQPVVVVVVVGLYRTGKSYLMNRLAGKHTGFALGSTIESKTKGIWMWCVPHPSKPGHTLVLLDTEGLGDVEKGDERHDTWIFCLAVLLSSSLVYNSTGTIDNTALEKLQYVTELTEHIKVKSSGYDQTTELMRVSFVWTVRDFTLDLILNGTPITADQYLENALKLKPGHSAEILRHNQVRQGLKDFFAERRCFAFKPPASTKNMRRLEELTDADLESDFVEVAKQFCSHIFSSAKPKTMRGGLGVTGRMLGSLAETYVKAIRSGQVPCLDSAVESLALIQNGRAVTEALEFYEKEMERWVRLPTETQEALSEIHAAAEKQAVSIFISGSFNDQEHKHQLELMRSMQERYKDWCGRNVQESRRVCERLLLRLCARLDRILREGALMRPGGYRAFSVALQEVTKIYRTEKCKGLMSEEVLRKCLREKEVSGKIILQADRLISAAQKDIKEGRRRAEEEARRVRSQEEERQRQKQHQRDEERSFRQNLEQLEEKMERERRRAQEERERVINAKLQVRKRVINAKLQVRKRVINVKLQVRKRVINAKLQVRKRVINAKLQEQRELLEQGYKERAESLGKEAAALHEEAEREAPRGQQLFSSIINTLGTAALVFMPGIGKVLGVGLIALSHLV
ncbi:guanylate-binding protein 1-like isoform X3 [Alosa sapidissima]|uniref:guanylate-binding protein 1-like isoform X3 n=1 Tax=Alosa sapidissima TaxID=34773 RepID=UPI001C093228|nr:guanylate-binding protein 1-like isoform X3 [Alosa sapidissima]